MKGKLITALWRFLLLIGGATFAWAIISVNMADHYLDKATTSDTKDLGKALLWDPSHPRARALFGAHLLQTGDQDKAEKYLVSSIVANPADARPLMVLAELKRREGEIGVADRMVETANRLMPVDASVQQLIAAYWYERGKLGQAIPHLSVALSADPATHEALFPIFLQIAENSGTRPELKMITDNPPDWWESFAVYASRNAVDINSLRALASMRRQSDVQTISHTARNAYIDRLKKEGLLAEAYLLWVDGLDQEQRGSLAYLYNGGFEQEFSNSGFGWYSNVPKNKGIVVSTATSYGINGDQALYLSFSGKRQRFAHLRQSLFLSPGRYQFSGRVRVDRLQARKGLQWVIVCSQGEGGTLGESHRFLGATDWRTFEFEITVPDECKGQLLQLQSVGHRDVDHELKGDIWFDDLRIRLQRPTGG